MNFLIIDNSIAFTGAFKCALNQAEILSEEGHRFIFIIPSGSKNALMLKEKGFPVYTLPLRELSRSPGSVAVYPFFLLKNLWRLKKIIREENIEIVQVNDFYNLLGAALKATGYKGKLLTYVRFLPRVFPASLRRLWNFAAQKFSFKIIAVSRAVLEQLPPDPGNICIYDPVKLEEKYDFTERTADDAIRFLYLANFTRGKGQEYAVEAFKLASGKNKNLRLKFIGGDLGLRKNKEFRKELEEKVKTSGLQEMISFQGFSADSEKEIKAADAVLNFSEAESFSMTCLEAGFYRKPVIATRCGGPEEIISDDKTGVLVPLKDIHAMSEAMLKLAADKALREKMGKNAREYIEEKFGIADFKKAYLKNIF